MRGPFDGDEFLVGALRDIQEVFAISDEIVALHGNDEDRSCDSPQSAWNRIVAGAPINPGVIEGIGRSNRIRTQKGFDRQDPSLLRD